MRTRRPGAGSIAALLSAAIGLSVLAQSPALQTPVPTFRSTVDLLTIETSVRDKRGVPAPDLQPADFVVTIDGRPRRVVSAQFFKSEASDARVTAGAPPTSHHVTNADASPGRAVVFMIDGESIFKGQEKALFETASKMLDALSPADAVGLLELSAPTIDLTRDRAAVRDRLQRFNGVLENSLSPFRLTFDEAVAIERGDQRVLDAVVSRECSNSSESCRNASERAIVRNGVIGEGRHIAFTERTHARQLLQAMTSLLQQLSAVRAPRSVILISGGMPIDPEIMAYYKDLERAAAESRVMLYTVRLGQMDFDMSRGRPGANVAGDPALANGLASVSSMTGGLFFTGTGKATGIFDRIASEVTSFYQLGLEASPVDADGKEHNIKVSVSRPGLDVRAASHVAVAKPSNAAAPDVLGLALQQPTDISDLPLAVTTYSMHGTGGAVRLLVSAEIGAAKGAAASEWGLAVTQNGKNIVKTRGKIPAGPAGPRVMSTSVDVAPGQYQLRVAAVDADDRAGVIEVPITAGFQEADGTRFGDLLIGVTDQGELEPRRRIAQSEAMTAMLELTGDVSGDVRGTLQLVRSGTAQSAVSVPLSKRPGASGGPAILQASVPLAAVTPGRYTASAALSSGGQPLTRVSRVIEITAAPVLTTPDSAPASKETAAETLTPEAEAPLAPLPAGASADDVVRRMAGYVDQYGGQASVLVAVEDYVQSVTVVVPVMRASRGRITGVAGVNNAPGEKRRLVSEFALVPNAAAVGGWLGFRDVMQVDGKPVADRHDRLQSLFRADVPDIEEARRIGSESARYNIGPVSRNFNVPTTTLFFFHPGNLSRFIFHRKGTERIDGVETVAVEFRETRVPTLVMNSAGKDVPASGTLWVNPADGAVVRTRLELDGFHGAGSHAEIDVVYRKDAGVGMWVPARMAEKYSGGMAGTATTTATYKDFKRFQTTAKIK